MYLYIYIYICIYVYRDAPRLGLVDFVGSEALWVLLVLLKQLAGCKQTGCRGERDLSADLQKLLTSKPILHVPRIQSPVSPVSVRPAELSQVQIRLGQGHARERRELGLPISAVMVFGNK